MLEGRLLIQQGRANEGIRVLQALGQEAAEGSNLELAAQIRQALADSLADPRFQTLSNP
ncbi:hypothetical protein ACIQJT_35190 [Streptomyces sp. NPDC091972]|uniref:hypothetical protein n=1 Tax=Streptomyces sp. NPDC091972 TaxID=3366007 RepID=UPI0037F6710D